VRIQDLDGEAAFLAFEYGGKIMVDNLFISTGGGASNTAIALAKLGMKAGIVCEVGEDDPARQIRRALEGVGVDCSMIITNPGIATGYSVILTGFTGDRTVLVHRGAARDLSRGEVAWDQLKGTKWIYLGALAGPSAALWEEVGRFACENGLKLAVNPGADQIRLGLVGLKPVLECTEVIFVNEAEAYRIAGVEEKCGDEDECLTMRALHEAGCRLVVMTNGAEGARAYDGEAVYQVPARPVEVVSTLGAGDAFASGCISALFRGLDLRSALLAGNLNASSVVGSLGATVGLLTWEEVEGGLARNEDK